MGMYAIGSSDLQAYACVCSADSCNDAVAEAAATTKLDELIAMEFSAEGFALSEESANAANHIVAGLVGADGKFDADKLEALDTCDIKRLDGVKVLSTKELEKFVPYATAFDGDLA